MAAEAGILLASTAAQERKDTQGHVASPSIVMTTINKDHLSVHVADGLQMPSRGGSRAVFISIRELDDKP